MTQSEFDSLQVAQVVDPNGVVQIMAKNGLFAQGKNEDEARERFVALLRLFYE